MKQMLGSLEHHIEYGEWRAISGLCAGILNAELEKGRKTRTSGHEMMRSVLSGGKENRKVNRLSGW